jgi:hypothetical protein
VAVIGPKPYDRRVHRLVILGPDFSVFTMYMGNVISTVYARSTTNLGVRNTATFDPPLEIGAGESALGVWTGGSTTSATPGLLTVEYESEFPAGG